MSTYLLINIAIILVPLLFSFERKLRFYRKIPFVIISTFTAGIFFIVWDIYAAGQGHWSFNQKHTGNLKISGLPLEEILFFITVPYAMLFLYETFSFYLKNRFNKSNIKVDYLAVLFFLLSAASLLISGITYTSLALISCFIFFLISFFYSDLSGKSIFWAYMAFAYLPFLIVNYILTSLPVVEYNDNFILGFRILTIPIEDFLYSFSLVSFYLLIYTTSISLCGKKNDKS